MFLKPLPYLTLLLLCSLLFCRNNAGRTNDEQSILPAQQESGFATVSDIPVPHNHQRVAVTEDAFGSWLRKLSLKADNTVYLYNGNPKPNQQVQFAVLDVYLPPENLQQCADAVMRLRAEFLFSRKRYQDIVFFDNDKKAYRFEAPYNATNLEQYLRRVFSMCGTASLARQLPSKPLKNMQPGDVLVRGGFPGHAVIVMDVVTNSNGEKQYLLAQSYMPAQNIHILKNPANDANDPWYRLDGLQNIVTPEYTFHPHELKGW